jgi:hypothetical protein
MDDSDALPDVVQPAARDNKAKLPGKGQVGRQVTWNGKVRYIASLEACLRLTYAAAFEGPARLYAVLDVLQGSAAEGDALDCQAVRGTGTS